MKRLNLIYLFLSLALLAPSLTGCSDDLDLDDNRQHQIKTGIVLKIPNIRSMASRAQTRADDPLTRAEANAIENEGGIVEDGSARDFWVFIYKSDGENGTPVEHIQLNAPEELPSLDASGKPKYYGYNNGTNTYYEIALDPTSYRVYLVANLSEYVSSTLNWENISESELKGLIMDLGSVISSQKANTILQPGHLPMVCMPTDIDGADPDTGNIDVAKADVKELKANLVFQCAKIRYTILFDNNTPDANGNGFSYAGFTNHLLDFTSATIRNLSRVTRVNGVEPTTSDANPLFLDGPFTAALSPVVYPTDGADYVKPNADPTASVSGDRVTDLTARDPWTATSSKQRAWQGVIYVPENKSKTTKTTMTFAGVVDPNNGTGINNSYTINLIGPGGNSSTVTPKDPATGTGSAMSTDSHVTIDRGTFYDLTLLAKKMNAFDINFTVKDWTTDQLVYDLHGPYELYVNDTQVSVASGEITEIPYRTNADKLEFTSSKFTRANGTSVDVFDLSYDNENIYVTVNPALTVDECNTISSDKTNYNFFHVKAGNINKKIIADPLNLDPFIMVSPEEITIDVREQRASGMYEGAFPITVKTNYPGYTVTGIDWTEVTTAGENTSTLVYLAYKDGAGNYQNITFGSERTKPANGTEVLYLVYKDLNGGHKFWNDANHTFYLNFKATGDTENHKVQINTKRASDNYIIHFKPKSSENWTKPHIYVYQCLEIPGNRNYKKNFSDFGGPNPFYTAGQPVGYYKLGNDGNAWAALEYDLTGHTAFKGWEYSGNKEELDKMSSPTYTCGWSHGFFVFSDGMNSDDNSWNASKDKSNDRYYKNMEFNEDWRASISSVCSDCEGWGNNLWPGIAMKPEGDGWYYFELSSIATPGKALIMFSDQHSRDKDYESKRFPGKDQVGIPLFDYPAREGWIEQDGVFTSRKGTSVVITNYKYRIYFLYNSNNFKGLNVWNDNSNPKFSAGNTEYSNFSAGTTQSTNRGTYYKHNNNYAYLELDWLASQIPSTMSWAAPKSNAWGTIQKSLFTLVDGVYCVTINTTNSTVKSGKP